MKYILIDEQRRQNAIKHIQELDIAKPFEVNIEPYVKNRTLSQNRLMWKWIGLIADHTGYTPEQQHKELKYKYLGIEYITVGGIDIPQLKSTTDLTTREFATYLSEIEAFAIDYEIILPHPEDYHFAMMLN